MFGVTTTESARDLTDEEVLARSGKEPWIFAVLLDRYQDAFMRKARAIVKNQQDAEEIVQDTFTKIYQNADRFEVREGASFSSWGYRILINTACTWYQKRVKEGQRFASIDPEYEQLFGACKEHSGFEEYRDAVDRVLARLPGHFARVLRLHYLERWSHQDIAADQHTTTGAIKARIHRAKRAFKKEARDGEVELLLQ